MPRTAGAEEVIVMDRRIDLDRARRDAKALLRAARGGDPEALGRLRADREPRLADAQQVVARDLGEPNWAALVHRVEAEGALIDAAREGRADAVSTLLERGVDPNVREPDSGGTALHVAASMGWADVVDALVGWVPLDLHARDATGNTALGACVAGSARGRAGAHLVIAKVLVSVGLRIEPEMLDRGSEEVVAWLAARPARRPPTTEHGEAAWSAAVALAAHVARSPLAERRPVGDGFAFRTGLLDNTRNGVVCSRLPGETADATIEELVRWFGETPAQWMLAAQTEPADLGTRLEHAGCRPEHSAVFMSADLANRDLDDARLPTGVEIEPLREDAPLRHYEARVAGEPVGIVSAFTVQPTLLLTELAVEPHARRQGIGRALVLHALRDGARAGAGSRCWTRPRRRFRSTRSSGSRSSASHPVAASICRSSANSQGRHSPLSGARPNVVDMSTSSLSLPAARERVRPAALSFPRPELAVLLVAAGVLYLWALDRNGFANEYYSAAVRSMSTSWHAFLYGAFDTAGVMTVDKPPLALWVQALSARVFGLHSWSMLVPQALMGVGTVALTYDMTRRHFGRAAGFVAGLALVLTPVTVAIVRHNNPDALLVLCCTAALWFVVRGLEDGRTRWIVLAGVAVGLGFEAKMAAALLVVPALVAAYLWVAPRGRAAAVRSLAAGGAAMAAVGLAWPLLIWLTPPPTGPGSRARATTASGR